MERGSLVGEEGSRRTPSRPLGGGGIPSACRAPTCSILFSLPPFPLRNTGRRLPSPGEPTLVTHAVGRAHAQTKARGFTSISGASSARGHGWGWGQAEPEGSAIGSRPWVGCCLKPAPSAYVVGLSSRAGDPSLLPVHGHVGM